MCTKSLRNLLIDDKTRHDKKYMSKKCLYNIILAQTSEIEEGLGRFLSCGARKPEQT